MIARVLRLSLDSARIEDARQVASEYLPAIGSTQAGLVQLFVLASRLTGTLALIELRGANARVGEPLAGELALRLARFARSVGSWEPYEVVGFQPGDGGTAAWLTTTHQAPDVAPIAERVREIRGPVLAVLDEQPGFRGLVALMDRERGRAIGCTFWDDATALERAREHLRDRTRDYVDRFQLLLISETTEVLARLDGSPD